MPPDSPLSFDIVIVGGGPAGLAAGAWAATQQVSHVVLERGQLANTIFQYQKGKFVMAEPHELSLHDELGALLHFEEGSREQILGWWQSGTQKAGTNVWAGPENEATKIEGSKGAFTVTLRDGRKLACGAVVLAFGLQANLNTFGGFGVPGADAEVEDRRTGKKRPMVTYQLDDPAEHEDENVVVIGVGDAGIENALALKDANQVSVINKDEEIDRAKARNRKALLDAAHVDDLEYYSSTGIKGFEPRRVILRRPEGEHVLEDIDLVIGRLGARPPRAFLSAMGIEFQSPSPDAPPKVNPETYESNVAGIYIVGALTGKTLIKDCLNQGFEAVGHIIGKPVTPADEPLLARNFAIKPGAVNELIDRIRKTVPIFASLTTIQLREYFVQGGTAILRPKEKEAIYQRGELGEFFYAILGGSVDVVSPSISAAADTIYSHQPKAEGRKETRITLRAGEFFGEGTLLSGAPRSATVVAGPDTTLLQVPRFAMTRLMKSSPEVKRSIDEVFILRQLQNTFAPVGKSGAVSIDELRELARAAVVETFITQDRNRNRKGQDLFRELLQDDDVLFEQDQAWFMPSSLWFEQGKAWLAWGEEVFVPDEAWSARGRAWFPEHAILLSRQGDLARQRDRVAGKAASPSELDALARTASALRADVAAWVARGEEWLAQGLELLQHRELWTRSGTDVLAAGQAWLQAGRSWFAKRGRSTGLHLIRRGSVTVSVASGSHEAVLAYVPVGSLSGEMALLCPDGLRGATVKASPSVKGHRGVLTETIRIPGEVVLPFIERHPELRRDVDDLVRQRQQENVARSVDQQSGDLVEFLVRAGAGEATDILLIDERLCVRCDNCEKACADTHDGISRLDREAGPTFAYVHVPTSCRHCENPLCMSDCDGKCIHRHPTGEVYIDTERCVACGHCERDCPYGVIKMAEGLEKQEPAGVFGVLASLLFARKPASAHAHGGGEKGEVHKAVKCDLCANMHVRERGVPSACVSACPTGALVRVSPKEYFERSMHQ